MSTPTTAAHLRSRHFGSLPSGEPVEAWTLTGNSGLILEAITYGGIVTKLLYPVGEGDWLDLVLGFNELDPYLENPPYFGAIVGRVAGRLSDARFTLDGNTFHLPANEPPNHLHGGAHGFDKKLWTAATSAAADGAPSLRLTYSSPHGEEGYPGTVSVSVTYTVTNENALVIDTHANTDRPTPLSLTHHSYFNLAGEGFGTIAGHTLQVDADEFLATTEDLTLTDQRRPVEGLPDDLRQPALLSDTLPRLTRGHGALYAVRQPAVAGELVRIATFTHPFSGRTLTCFTTHTHLQVYTASAFDGSMIGKSGKSYRKYAGLCLECHGYPNGANRPDLGDIILRPGAPQRHTTVYAFSLPQENGRIPPQNGKECYEPDRNA
jgi:aldose 1-epimerase